jgi:hypothetical protein
MTREGVKEVGDGETGRGTTTRSPSVTNDIDDQEHEGREAKVICHTSLTVPDLLKPRQQTHSVVS